MSATAVVLAALGAAACGGSGKNGAGGPRSHVLPPGTGYCQATCEQTCALDADCSGTAGQVCCDFGSAGKMCLAAGSCPRLCADDSACNASTGQGCFQTDLSVPDKICTAPSNGITICTSDSQCADNRVCCRIYGQGVCLSAAACPNACARDSDCQTAQGETCCTTVGALEPALNVKGLCLAPAYQPCPKACTQSSDCNAQDGALCCNGVCQATCPKTCQQSTECDGQLCCKSPVARRGAPTRTFNAGPHCVGTPMFASCDACGRRNDCATQCAGCTETTPGFCSGASEFIGCSGLSFDTCLRAVCDWNGGCTGSPDSCEDRPTEAACANDSGCTYTHPGCTGTLTPCAALSAAACSSQPGCTYVSN